MGSKWTRNRFATRGAASNLFSTASFVLSLAGISSLLFAGAALADAEIRNPNAGASYESESKNAQANLQAQGKHFDVSLSGKHLYNTAPEQPNLNRGRVFLSDDGRTLVWMLPDRFSGNIMRAQGIDHDILASPALLFYHNGKMVKSYTLEQLLVRPKMLSVSVSHTQWIPEKRDENWKFSPTVVFAPNGKALEFDTTSMRHYVFNPETGEMLTGEDTKIWNDADVVAYVQLDGGSGKLQAKQGVFMKGKIDDLASANIFDPSGSFDAGWHAIALKKTLGFYTAIAPAHQTPVLYNILQ